SNRGFAEWGEIFGSPVVATALLDRLLHHAIVIQIDGSSYRLRPRCRNGAGGHLKTEAPCIRQHENALTQKWGILLCQ
ncbi:MAG: ATP-binding protein, partial [Sphingomonadaceae bacterium]